MVDRAKQGANYVPGFLATDGDLVRYLDSELNRISLVIAQLNAGHIDKTYAAPVRPRDGDLRYADGTEWNPGSGEGFYGYVNGVWTPFGAGGEST